MRITFFTHYFPPEVNAPASRTYEHCVRWARAGHEVTVITGIPNHPHGQVYPGYSNHRLSTVESVDGLRVVRVWTYLAANEGTFRRTANYLSYAVSAAWRGCRGARPDVVVATSPQFFCAWAGLAAARAWRCPFVLEVRDLWPESIAAVGACKSPTILGTLEYLEQRLYRAADHLVTVGPGYRERIVERFPDLADRCSVVTNGVDLSAWPIRPADPFLRSEWNGPEPAQRDRFVCAYVGTLGMAHGLGTVLEAAQRLRARGRTDVVFWLVGDGADRTALEQRAAELGVADMLVFAGQVPKRQVANVLATADATLVHLRDTPLFQTVLPSKMFEAMALNRPTVVAVPGATRQLAELASARTGWPIAVIPPENPQALADAVARWADDPERLASTVRRTQHRVRQFVAANFSRESLADQMLGLLQAVAGSGVAARVDSFAGLAAMDSPPTAADRDEYLEAGHQSGANF